MLYGFVEVIVQEVLKISILVQEGLFNSYVKYLLVNNYHRIFTLRCIHSELVPVSIKLKSTLKSERAKKILRMAEKQLLQTRFKSINSLLDNNAKQN